MARKKTRKHKVTILEKRFLGFTLIELLVSITILSVFSTAGFVTYSHSQSQGQDAKRRQDILVIYNALKLYHLAHKGPACEGFPCQGGSSDIPYWSHLSDGGTAGAITYDGLVPNYINQVPVDPVNSATHAYFFHGGVICARLDHPQPKDPSCPLNFTCGSQAGSLPCNFGYSAR